MAKKDIESEEVQFEERQKIIAPHASDAVIPIGVKLLEKEKAMMDMEFQLENLRDEYNTRLRKLAKRREQFREKEKLFLKSLLKFETCLLENDREVDLTNSRIKQVGKIQAEKLGEKVEMEFELQDLQEKVSILNKYLEKYEPAQNFMEDVVNSCEDFEKFSDVADTYRSLRIAYDKLIESEEALQDSIDEENEKLLKYKTEKKNQMLTYSNKLDEMKIILKKAQGKYLELEDQLFEETELSTAKAMRLEQEKMEIEHMFRLISKYEAITLKKPGCHIEMLKKIEEFIIDWSEVIEEVKK